MNAGEVLELFELLKLFWQIIMGLAIATTFYGRFCLEPFIANTLDYFPFSFHVFSFLPDSPLPPCRSMPVRKSWKKKEGRKVTVQSETKHRARLKKGNGSETDSSSQMRLSFVKIGSYVARRKASF